MIALETSPEPEEAARAREQAERLMEAHGLTRADFEDDVVEIADDRRDDLRQRLAIAVSTSRRCAAITNKRGQIAFRGRPGAATAARDLYQALVGGVSAHCEIGPMDPGRDVWRICYWMGFVDAVIERLVADEARAWTPKPAESAAPAPAAQPCAPTADPTRSPSPKVEVPPVENIREKLDAATQSFATYFHPSHMAYGVMTLRAQAYENGRNLGRGVVIAAREQAVPARRTLGGRDRASS